MIRRIIRSIVCGILPCVGEEEPWINEIDLDDDEYQFIHRSKIDRDYEGELRAFRRAQEQVAVFTALVAGLIAGVATFVFLAKKLASVQN